MTFEEYLISKGVTDEQASEIVSDMSKNEFYLASEEKMDERYPKLKRGKEQLETELETTKQTLKDLKDNHPDVDDLQSTIQEHETKVAELEQEIAEQVIEFSLKTALANVGALDVDYFADKMKDEVSVDEDGELVGFDEAIKEYQTKHPNLFPSTNSEEEVDDRGGFKVLDNNLDGGDPSPKLTKREIYEKFPKDKEKRIELLQKLEEE